MTAHLTKLFNIEVSNEDAIFELSEKYYFVMRTHSTGIHPIKKIILASQIFLQRCILQTMNGDKILAEMVEK